jgi:carbonic anhydrase
LPARSNPHLADLLDAARRHAEAFEHGDLNAPPVRQLAIVTCMDARVDPFALLGLRPGDAHVIRNAGGLVTDDVVRSLAISQRALGTTHVMVMRHTACGMFGLHDEELRAALRDETGVEPPWRAEDLTDLDADLRRAVDELRDHPLLPATKGVGGYVYDVETGELREVVSF